MRILGIDPGSRVTGYGVVDSDGRQSRYVDSGCVRTQTKDFAQRLGEIFEGVREVIQINQPELVAVEQVFVAHNPGSALKLGQARGAAITAAVSHKLRVFEYTPRAVKLALVGTGAADKTQVQHMVRMILSLTQALPLDASDALAVALCHAHTDVTRSRLEQGA